MKGLIWLIVWLLFFAFIGFWYTIEQVGSFVRQAIDQLKQEKIRSEEVYYVNHKKMIRHQLRPGETLTSLQNLYGVDWRVLKRLNHIDNERTLSVGQIVEVPILDYDDNALRY